MYGRGTVEVARKQTFSPKTDLFVNFGYEVVIMGYVARTYGIGIDYLRDDARKLYLRFEIDLYKTIFSESGTDNNRRRVDLVLPSVGIGYRF